MLIEFRAENFRSIKTPVTLSLVAASKKARDEKTDANNLIKVNNQLSLLRGVAIYGANASGKSNIIRAFSVFRSMVQQSAAFQEEKRLPMEPFMLTIPTQTQPSTFEIVFLNEGVQYRYGFTADTTRIHAEWLFALLSSRESMFFTRDTKNEGFPNGIEVNKTKFQEGTGTEKKTGANQLFLSKVAADQGEIAKKLRDYLVKKCQVVYASEDSTSARYTMNCLKGNKEGHRSKIVELVRRLDVDVIDLRVEEEEISPLRQRMHQALVDSDFLLKEAMEAKQNHLYTRHRVRDSNGVPVEEVEYDYSDSVSEGTRKLISLAGPIVDTLETGKTLFIDEIDARLHPKMTRAIIELFLNAESNQHNAQIIFVTHDTNLLDRRLLRRDQIYFCEKEQDATRLYSLADFTLSEAKGGSKSVRNDASFETDYIEGRYGAVPFLGDIRGLFREEFTAETEVVPS